MRCQILFCGENKKNMSVCHLLKFLSSIISVESIKAHVWQAVLLFILQKKNIYILYQISYIEYKISNIG